MERRCRGVQLRSVLGQVAQRLGLLVLALPGSQGRREVDSRQADQLLVALRQRPARAGGPHPKLTDELLLRDQRGRQRIGRVRDDPGRGGDRAIGPNHDRTGQIERLGEPNQRRLHARFGGLRRERRLADGTQQPFAGNRARRPVAEPAAEPGRGGFVQRDRDHEGHRREERKVEAEHPATGGVDRDQRPDRHEQAQPETERRPERLAGHLWREEDAGRQDGRGGQDHGHGNERDPDPRIGAAEHRQEADGASDRGNDDRRDGDLQLAAPRIRRSRRSIRLEQPDGPDRQRPKAVDVPRPAEQLARNRAEAEVRG